MKPYSDYEHLVVVPWSSVAVPQSVVRREVLDAQSNSAYLRADYQMRQVERLIDQGKSEAEIDAQRVVAEQAKRAANDLLQEYNRAARAADTSLGVTVPSDYYSDGFKWPHYRG
jgi:hypothetical protein